MGDAVMGAKECDGCKGCLCGDTVSVRGAILLRETGTAGRSGTAVTERDELDG